MSEPVVLNHGLEGDGAGYDDARPPASAACWAARPPARLDGLVREKEIRRFNGGLGNIDEDAEVPIAQHPVASAVLG